MPTHWGNNIYAAPRQPQATPKDEAEEAARAAAARKPSFLYLLMSLSEWLGQQLGLLQVRGGDPGDQVKQVLLQQQCTLLQAVKQLMQLRPAFEAELAAASRDDAVQDTQAAAAIDAVAAAASQSGQEAIVLPAVQPVQLEVGQQLQLLGPLLQQLAAGVCAQLPSPHCRPE